MGSGNPRPGATNVISAPPAWANIEPPPVPVPAVNTAPAPAAMAVQRAAAPIEWWSQPQTRIRSYTYAQRQAARDNERRRQAQLQAELAALGQWQLPQTVQPGQQPRVQPAAPAWADDTLARQALEQQAAGMDAAGWAPLTSFAGQLQRQAAAPLQRAGQQLGAGDIGGAASTIAQETTADAAAQAWKAFREQPGIGTGVNLALTGLGAAITPLLPKGLYPILNLPTQAIKSGINTAGDQATEAAARGEFTLEGQMKAAAEGRKVDWQAPTLDQEVRETVALLGEDYSAKYRQDYIANRKAFGVLPFAQQIAQVEARLTGMDTPEGFALRASANVTGPEARKQYAQRVAAGENPYVVQNGLVMPDDTAPTADREAFIGSYQEFVAARGRLARAQAIKGGASDAQAARVQAEAEDEADRIVKASGMIPSAADPMKELAMELIIGFSPLDPINVIPMGKIFGLSALQKVPVVGKAVKKISDAMPRTEARQKAAWLDEVYDAEARNLAGETQAERIAAAQRGLSVTDMQRRERAGKMAADDTVPPLTRQMAKWYLSYTRGKGYTAQARAHILDGHTLNVLSEMAQRSNTPADLMTKLGTFVAVPEQLIPELGNMPVSVRGEFARPVVEAILNEIPKLPSLKDQAGPLNPLQFLSEVDELTAMATRDMAGVKPFAERSALEKISFYQKRIMGEFFLRNPGYILRNAGSDTILAAQDGFNAATGFQQMTAYLDQFGIKPGDVIGGKYGLEGEQTGMRSMLSDERVPGLVRETLGRWQDFMGNVNNRLETQRRVSTFGSAFSKLWPDVWRPTFDPAVRQALAPSLGKVVDQIEGAWRGAKNEKELRAAVQRILNPTTPADTWTVTGALDQAGLGHDTIPATMVAEIEARVRQLAAEGADDATIETAWDTWREQVLEHKRKAIQAMGDVVHPRQDTHGVVEQDLIDHANAAKAAARQMAEAGLLNTMEAELFSRQWVQALVDSENGVRDLRAEALAVLRNLPDDADPTNIVRLYQWAMNEEYGARDAYRNTQGKLEQTARIKADKVRSGKGNAAGKQQMLRAIWDDYRKANDENARKMFERVNGAYKWLADGVKRVQDDPRAFDEVVGDRFKIETGNASADWIIEQMRKLVGDTADLDAFKTTLASNRYKVEVPRRETWRQATAIARAEPALATDVLDVLMASERSVQEHAIKTVLDNRLLMTRRDEGNLSYEKWREAVDANWQTHFDFAAYVYGPAAEARLQWLQVRRSTTAQALRDLGITNDEIAQLFSRIHTPEGQQAIIDALAGRPIEGPEQAQPAPAQAAAQADVTPPQEPVRPAEAVATEAQPAPVPEPEAPRPTEARQALDEVAKADAEVARAVEAGADPEPVQAKAKRARRKAAVAAADEGVYVQVEPTAREKWRDHLRKNLLPKVSQEDFDAAFALYDARAYAWSKATGEAPEKWYEQFTRVEGGSAADGTTLSQAVQVERAAVSFDQAGRAFIRALKAPNMTTFVHEFGHILARQVDDADMATVAQYMGFQSWDEVLELRRQFDAGQLTEGPRRARIVEGEERFARAFERYMLDGQTPSEGLAAVFARLKSILAALYAKMRGYTLDTISDEMRGVFDRLLADEVRADTQRAAAGDEVAAMRAEMLTPAQSIRPDEQPGLLPEAQPGAIPDEWTPGTPTNRPAPEPEFAPDAIPDEWRIAEVEVPAPEPTAPVAGSMALATIPAEMQPVVDRMDDVAKRIEAAVARLAPEATKPAEMPAQPIPAAPLALPAPRPVTAQAAIAQLADDVQAGRVPIEEARQRVQAAAEVEAKRAGVTKAPAEQPAQPAALIQVTPEDFDIERARQSAAHNTRNPDRFAQQMRDDYVRTMQSVVDEMSKLATADNFDALRQALEDFRAGLLQRTYAWLDSRGRTMSTFIAGPSKFDAKGNQKRLDAEAVKMQAMIDWQKKAVQNMRDQFGAAQRAERAAAMQTKRAEASATIDDFIRATVKPGDLVDVGGNDPVQVKRVNAKSITTNMGTQYALRTVRLVDENGRPMSADAMMQRFREWREGQAKPAEQPAAPTTEQLQPAQPQAAAPAAKSYTVEPYAYAKDSVVVRPAEGHEHASIAKAMLDQMGARWVGRARGYVIKRSQLARYEQVLSAQLDRVTARNAARAAQAADVTPAQPAAPTTDALPVQQQPAADGPVLIVRRAENGGWRVVREDGRPTGVMVTAEAPRDYIETRARQIEPNARIQWDETTPAAPSVTFTQSPAEAAAAQVKYSKGEHRTAKALIDALHAKGYTLKEGKRGAARVVELVDASGEGVTLRRAVEMNYAREVFADQADQAQPAAEPARVADEQPTPEPAQVEQPAVSDGETPVPDEWRPVSERVEEVVEDAPPVPARVADEQPAPAPEVPAERPAEPVAEQPTPAPEPEPARQVEQPAPEAPAQPAAAAPPAPSGPYTLQSHMDNMKRLRAGAMTADEYKAAFEAFMANREVIHAELMKKTVKELVTGSAGGMKKAEIVDHIIGRLMSRYALGRPVEYAIVTSLDAMKGMESNYEGALRKLVASTDDAYLQKFVQGLHDEMAAVTKAMTNPETLEEFETFIGRKGEAALTPEQRVRYDALQAERSMGSRQQAEAVQAERRAASTTGIDLGGVALSIKETMHTRDRVPLWVVQMSGRVPRETYDALNSRAKQLGGHYSSFQKDAIGFIFRSKEAAEKMMDLQASTAPVIQERAAARELTAAQSAAERLRRYAGDMTREAEDALSRDRKANTVKRAREAGQADSQARGNLARAKTMLALADMIESGEVQFLSGVTAKTHLDTLDHALSRAQQLRMRAGKLSYEEGRPYAVEDIEYAEYPYPAGPASALRSMADEAEKVQGFKLVARQLRKIAGTGDDVVRLTNSDDIEALKTIREGFPSSRAYGFMYGLEDYQRMQAMGIKTLPELRAALREYFAIREAKPMPDKVRELQRAMVGVPIPGYFPTPAALASQVAEAADVKPGMTVLEPSAGGGALIDAVRRAAPGVEVDALELNSRLRELLEAKGYTIVGGNALTYETPKRYDRIVMNPPFGRSMGDGTDLIEIDHVRKAYDLLKPGGRLVAITGEGPFFNQATKAAEFRAWLDSLGATYEKLPEGSFKDSDVSTGVNTRLVVINKPGGEAPAVATVADAVPTQPARDLSTLKAWEMLPEEFTQVLNDELARIRTIGDGDPSSPVSRSQQQTAFNELKTRLDAPGLQFTDGWNPERAHARMVMDALARDVEVSDEIMRMTRFPADYQPPAPKPAAPAAPAEAVATEAQPAPQSFEGAFGKRPMEQLRGLKPWEMTEDEFVKVFDAEYESLMDAWRATKDAKAKSAALAEMAKRLGVSSLTTDVLDQPRRIYQRALQNAAFAREVIPTNVKAANPFLYTSDVPIKVYPVRKPGTEVWVLHDMSSGTNIGKAGTFEDAKRAADNENARLYESAMSREREAAKYPALPVGKGEDGYMKTLAGYGDIGRFWDEAKEVGYIDQAHGDKAKVYMYRGELVRVGRQFRSGSKDVLPVHRVGDIERFGPAYHWLDTRQARDAEKAIAKQAKPAPAPAQAAPRPEAEAPTAQAEVPTAAPEAGPLPEPTGTIQERFEVYLHRAGQKRWSEALAQGEKGDTLAKVKWAAWFDAMVELVKPSKLDITPSRLREAVDFLRIGWEDLHNVTPEQFAERLHEILPRIANEHTGADKVGWSPTEIDKLKGEQKWHKVLDTIDDELSGKSQYGAMARAKKGMESIEKVRAYVDLVEVLHGQTDRVRSIRENLDALEKRVKSWEPALRDAREAAEKMIATAPRRAAEALQPLDYKKHSASRAQYSGNVMAPGKWVSDGFMVARTDQIVKGAQKYTAPDPARPDKMVPQESMENILPKREPSEPVKLAGVHLSLDKKKGFDIAVLVPENPNLGFVLANPDKLALLSYMVGGFDSIKIVPESVDKYPLLALYKKGDRHPVGYLMGISRGAVQMDDGIIYTKAWGRTREEALAALPESRKRTPFVMPEFGFNDLSRHNNISTKPGWHAIDPETDQPLGANGEKAYGEMPKLFDDPKKAAKFAREYMEKKLRKRWEETGSTKPPAADAPPAPDELKQTVPEFDVPDPDALRAQDEAVEQGQREGIHYTDVVNAATDETLRGLEAVRAGFRQHMAEAPVQPTKLTPEQRAVVQGELKRVTQQFYDARRNVSEQAKSLTNRSLLDYNLKRGFDTGLALAVPFSYWATRQGKNYAMRFLNNPGILAQYARYRYWIEQENKKNNVRGRFGTSLRVPLSAVSPSLSDVYVDPMAVLFPFAGLLGASDLNDSEQSRTALQSVMDMAAGVGFRPGPLLDIPLRMSGALTTKQPGEEGYGTEQAAYGPRSISQMIPQTGVIQGATAALGIGGPTGTDIESPIRRAFGLSEGEPLDAYRISRSVSDLAAYNNVGQGTIDERPYLLAQQFIDAHGQTDLQTALRDYRAEQLAADYGVDQGMAMQALQIAREAARMATQQRGFQQLMSFFGGLRAQQLPQGEMARWQMRDLERSAAYNPLTGTGNAADVQQVREAFPALSVQRAQYAALPGDEKDNSYIFTSAQRREVNSRFDALKDAVIQARPWDKKATRIIENARYAALNTIEDGPADMDAQARWQREYQNAIATITGQAAPDPARMAYYPKSIAGSTPAEALKIRQTEILRFVNAMRPEFDQFQTVDGEPDYDSYRLAVAEFEKNLAGVAMGAPAVAEVLAKADAEGLGAPLRRWLAKAGPDDMADYRRRNDTALEAMQRVYFDGVYQPTMAAFTALRDAGEPDAFERTVKAVGPISGADLIPLVEKVYGDRFSPEELGQLAGMQMPDMRTIMRENQSVQARAKSDAQEAFWQFMQQATPPGGDSYDLRQQAMIAAALDPASRATLTAEQYRLALAIARGWVTENYGEVTPELSAEWQQARAEKAQFDAAVVAQFGREGLVALQRYQAAGSAKEKEAVRRADPRVGRILAMRTRAARQFPMFGKYYLGLQVRARSSSRPSAPARP